MAQRQARELDLHSSSPRYQADGDLVSSGLKPRRTSMPRDFVRGSRRQYHGPMLASSKKVAKPEVSRLPPADPLSRSPPHLPHRNGRGGHAHPLVDGVDRGTPTRRRVAIRALLAVPGAGAAFAERALGAGINAGKLSASEKRRGERSRFNTLKRG